MSVSPTVPPKRTDRLRAGQRIADVFIVQSVIASGGLGQVYDATDESLGRRVALKVSWEEDRRLRAESRAMATFRHPSLPTLYALAKDGGMECVVLERIYGMTLSDQLAISMQAGEPLSAAEVEDIVRAAAGALATIHDAGLLHMAIRPENLVLTPERRVVLMDTGLVTPEGELFSQVRKVAVPAYSAPELLEPMDLPAARRADLFGLGVTAYELLTGKVPWEIHALSSLDRSAERASVDLGGVQSDAPGSLLEVIAKMLSLDPSDRPESAEQVHRHLARTSRRAASARAERAIRVMVVEDSAFVAKVLARYTEGALPDADVQIHESAETAAEALKIWAPDIMLLDLHMPKMSGIELCMYMRGAGLAPDCDIISVSAGANAEDRDLLKLLGIRHHLRKDPQLGDRLKQLLKQTAEGRG